MLRPWRLHHLLEQTGHAAIELDGSGNVVWLNEKAKAYLGTDFVVSSGRLHALDRRSEGELQCLLERLQAPAPQASPLAFISIERGNARPLIARVIFLNSGGPVPERAAVILLIDPNEERAPTQSMLQTVFHLTPAEARLAVSVARGRALEAIADEFGVAVGTVRAQLKAVFAKTGTTRQSELVALLARTALGFD